MCQKFVGAAMGGMGDYDEKYGWAACAAVFQKLHTNRYTALGSQYTVFCLGERLANRPSAAVYYGNRTCVGGAAG